MNKNKGNRVLFLNVNVSNDDEILAAISDFKKQGFEKLKVSIEGSIEDLLSKNEQIVDVFEKIKDKQALPDWVVLDFINSTGKLKDNDLKKRLEIE